MKHRRLMAAAAVVSTAAVLLTGCSGSGGSSNGGSTDLKGQTLSILNPTVPSSPNHAIWTAAVKKFEDKTGAKVKLITAADSEMITQFESSVLAGNEADLVNLNPVDKARTWVKNGAAIPVGDLIKKWGLNSEINPAAIPGWTIDGQVVGFPFGTYQWPVWFNKDLLAKAGVSKVPTTIAELKSAVKKLSTAGITPIAIGGSDWTGQGFLENFSQMYVPKSQLKKVWGDGQFCSTPSFMTGMDALTSLTAEGAFGPNAQGLTITDMDTAFFTGKAAIMYDGSWAFPAAPKSLMSSVQMGGFPVPDTSPAISKPAFNVGYNSDGFFVSKNGAKKLPLIEAFMKTMYSKSVVDSYVVKAGYVPAVKNVGKLPADANPLLANSTAAIPNTDRFTDLDPLVPAAAVGPMAQATATAYTQGKTANDVCKALEGVYAAAK